MVDVQPNLVKVIIKGDRVQGVSLRETIAHNAKKMELLGRIENVQNNVELIFPVGCEEKYEKLLFELCWDYLFASDIDFDLFGRELQKEGICMVLDSTTTKKIQTLEEGDDAEITIGDEKYLVKMQNAKFVLYRRKSENISADSIKRKNWMGIYDPSILSEINDRKEFFIKHADDLREMVWALKGAGYEFKSSSEKIEDFISI